jgi:hypothetical protein
MSPYEKIGVLDSLQIVGSENEKKIIQLFSEHFFVTFSRMERFKNSDYTIAFLKPTQRLTSSFNLHNEVLMLFSTYVPFQKRIFDYVDKLMQEYRNRLDKVCMFLVCADINIESQINAYNSENIDSRVVIPFSFDELNILTLSQNTLGNKLRKFFYNRDLFAQQSPIRSDAYFFGRNNIIQTLYDRYKQGEHSGLFGLRKIGKTSVLYALQRVISLRGGVSIYFDCQDTSIHLKRWNELLAYIITSIINEFTIEYDIGNTDERYSTKNASESFSIDFTYISGKIENRVLLIFDEIEHITMTTSSSEYWSKDNDYLYFWQTIRGVYQKDPYLYSFLIAGVNPLCAEKPTFSDYPNPIMNMLQPQYLELFDVHTINEMVSNIGKYMGLVFEDEIYTKLKEDYGGHPSLVRNVCSTINRNCKTERPYTITRYRYMELKKQLDNGISNIIDDIMYSLKKWYPDEYILLETLVIDGNDAFKEELQHNLLIVQHLKGYGIIEKSTHDYHITINAISEYIKNDHIKTALPSKYEKERTEVSTRRNAIEENLRNTVLVSLKGQYGKGPKLKSKILEVVDSTRKAKIEGKEIPDIMENHVLFSDIIKLIDKNWSLFDKIFCDKTKFHLYAEFINTHRIDAHTKSISGEDMATIRIAFQWFENSLSD